MTEEFKQFLDNTPLIREQIYPFSDNVQWGKLYCHWVEKRSDGTALTHLYKATIHLETGDSYLDCSRKKIWSKCCALTLIRPLHTILKTIYHCLLPISIPIEIVRALVLGVSKKENGKQIFKRSIVCIGRNLVDMVRTPFYGIAIQVVILAGVILGPKSSKLYEIRAVAGRLEKSLNWGKTFSFWSMSPCFHPLFNPMFIYRQDRNHANAQEFRFNDTIYHDPALEGISNFARDQIYFMRHQRTPFNHCFSLLPADQVYTSID